METINIIVDHYYIYPLFPFMPEEIHKVLSQAHFKYYVKAKVPKRKFDKMMRQYFDSLKN